MNNIITAVFGGRREARTRALYQYDYGIILQLIGPALPVAYEVHFSKSLTGEAAVVIGDEDGISIPDEYLTTAGTLYAWVYLHTGDSDGETRYTMTIPVTARAKPSDYEPTPVEQSVIEQAIAALNAGVTTVQNAVENIDTTVADALQAAKDSGEFDGPAGPGVPTGGDAGQVLAKATDADYDTEWVDMQGGSAVSPTATVVKVGDTATITITDKDGTTTAQISDGQDGAPGQDGVSPSVSVTTITGGHRVSITDAGGANTFDVMDGTNGSDGQDGHDGSDGYSPTASVSKSGDTVTISITDKNGTTTATVSDGPQGEPGDDYVLTAQDKADIADIVLGELPVYNGGVI